MVSFIFDGFLLFLFFFFFLPKKKPPVTFLILSISSWFPLWFIRNLDSLLVQASFVSEVLGLFSPLPSKSEPTSFSQPGITAFLFCPHLTLTMSGRFQRLRLLTSWFVLFNLTTPAFAAEPLSYPTAGLKVQRD